MEEEIEPPLDVGVLFPCNHKTAFLIDHTPYFGIPCGISMDFQHSNRPGTIPIRPISKSLWTCAVEATMDYCRIAWDLFPDEKLIRLLISDNTSKSLNTWTTAQQQNIYQIFGSLSGVGAPAKIVPTAPQMEYSIIHGFRPLVESLCERTEAQQRYLSEAVTGDPPLLNRCRAIVITSTRNNESIKNIEDILLNELVRANKLAATSDQIQAIDFCHFIIVNLYPNSTPAGVTGHERIMKKKYYMTEVFSVAAGTELSKTMMELLLCHYNLASTTVTGIPMKEEQSASSSANYNVELIHSADAHTAITSNPEARQMLMTKREGMSYDTVMLKWCTPRTVNSTSDLINCVAMHRVTPCEVNSRPSACLISFLLSGRTVLLEVPKKAKCFKGTAHMLSAQGGEVFIHTMNTWKPILLEFPGVTERNRARTSNLRIDDFKEFVRRNMLRPMKVQHSVDRQASSSNGSDVEFPIDKALKHLQRQTKYWPLTVSSTMIFNCKKVTEPLLTIIMKDQLNAEDIAQCKKCIYHLIAMEANKEELPIPTSADQEKVRIEEQYKMLLDELETYLKLHNYSQDHNDVITCLTDCRKKPELMMRAKKHDIELSLKELDLGSSDEKMEYEDKCSQAVVSMGNKSLSQFLEDRKQKTEKMEGELNATPTLTGCIGELYKNPTLYREALERDKS